MRNKRKKSHKKLHRKRTALGMLFWVAFILLIIVVLLICHERIMETSGGKKLLEIFNIKTEKKQELNIEDIKIENRIPEKSDTKKSLSDNDNVIMIGDINNISGKAPNAKTTSRAKSSRDVQLYYVYWTENGEYELKTVTRYISFLSTPLEATIRSLMEGVTTIELNKGLRSMIPSETKLQNIKVEHGIAYMDFSEEFMFNNLGREGIEPQLKQIVFTATEFPTVEKVQFLIAGNKIDYISEGIFIGEPLGRDSF